METAMAVLAGIGVLLYLGFVLAGAALLLGLPAIGLAAGAGQVRRAIWRGARVGTAPA